MPYSVARASNPRSPNDDDRRSWVVASTARNVTTTPSHPVHIVSIRSRHPRAGEGATKAPWCAVTAVTKVAHYLGQPDPDRCHVPIELQLRENATTRRPSPLIADVVVSSIWFRPPRAEEGASRHAAGCHSPTVTTGDST